MLPPGVLAYSLAGERMIRLWSDGFTVTTIGKKAIQSRSENVRKNEHFAT
jgi:hypothetical protein